MAKVVFPFHVIHGGRFYAPHKPFEVAESEVDELIARGAKVVGRSAEALEKASRQIVAKAMTRQTKSSSQKKG